MNYDATIANSAGVSTQPVGATAKKKGELDQADFLKMLVAQMKFQNPMEPQDPSKFMDQMSQMSMIQGMQKMQDTFKGMTNTLVANQALQATSLIGRTVLVPSDTGNLLPGGDIRGQVDLQQSTAALQVKVSDASGNVVKVMDLGTHPDGAVDFTWNGTLDDGTKAPTGEYKFAVDAMVEDKMTAQDIHLSALVDSVNIDKQGVALNLRDGRQFGLNDVSKIF